MGKLPLTLAGTDAGDYFFDYAAERFSIARWADALRQRLALRAARRLLEDLNDCQLRDIGLTRCMIEDVLSRTSITRLSVGDF